MKILQKIINLFKKDKDIFKKAQEQERIRVNEILKESCRGLIDKDD